MESVPAPGCRAARALDRLATRTLLIAGIATAWGGRAWATNSTVTIPSTPPTVDDSYLREDVPGENNGTNPILRIRSSSDHTNRNTIVRFPIDALTGRTVLQAWLDLKQTAGNSDTPIDARIYPLTESFNEGVVTWDTRDVFLLLGTPWSTPGGTHGPYWTDRALLSTAGTNSSVRWQVGPIVEAWNSAALANDGFLIQPQRSTPGREVAFASSDQTSSSLRPALVVQYTDEPPAIAAGSAEIQPRVVRTGSRGVVLTAWLDVDAQTSTPTGAPTGFDVLTVSHRGGLVVTGVNRLVVNGTLVPASAVSVVDDGSTATFRLPRIRTRGQVQLDFRADVLAPASDPGLDLPMTVDDSTTPGAGAQALWPGNADRVAGNGDDWLLGVALTPAVAIDLTPDSAQVQRGACLQLAVSGRDSLGNVFAVQPDSVVVSPPEAGGVSPGLQFCGAVAGTVRLIAYSGALRDTSTIAVLPDQPTIIRALALRDRSGSVTSAPNPADTMFVDVTLSDGNGLQDVKSIQFDVLHPAAGGSNASAYGASFLWTRGATPAWTLLQPVGTSWQVVPGLCSMDEASVTPGPATARLAFVVSRIARASILPKWTIRVRATSATPPGVADSTLTGLTVPARLSLVSIDPVGAFSAGPPGATGLALGTPSDARLHYAIEVNTSVALEAIASDLVGVTVPADTLHIAGPPGRLHWSFSADPGAGGTLSTAWSPIATWPAQDSETTAPTELYLWIDHPAGLPDQDYQGTLGLRLDASAFGAMAGSNKVALQASIVTKGFAAQLGLAEVHPHTITAGASSQVIDVDLLPYFNATDTGIDRIRVGLPQGYGAPAVTHVRVAGNLVAFGDLSVAGQAEVSLATKVTSSQLIELELRLDAPTALDSLGSAFVVVYDDQATAVPAQTATEGDANGQSDGNNWMVRVVVGPLARLSVSPPQAQMYRDSSITFSAEGADALGHPVPVAPTWRVEGGIGTIGAASGAFLATAPGAGRIIAQSGAVSDTAQVMVLPPRAIAIRSVSGPPVVYQGQTGVDLTVRIDNVAQAAVTLDTLMLVFSRGVPGDANAEFTIAASPPLPVTLAPGVTASLTFSIRVSASALLAPLSVQATASGNEAGTGIRLRDAAADTMLAMSVVAGGVELEAFQDAAPVRPTSSFVLMTLHVTNQYPDSRLLDRLVLANRTLGPGDRDRLDAELGDLALYLDDGDGVFDAQRDAVILKTVALGGSVTFAPLDVKLPAQSDRSLFVVSTLPVLIRDGDVLDVELASAADVAIEPEPIFRNNWPVGDAGGFTVDGMIAAELFATAVGPATVNPGAVDRLALDVQLPPNGYTPDMLVRLGVTNAGTALPGTDLQRLRAWIDDGDGAFSPTADHLLGSLAYTGGGRWQLSGLTQAVPVTGTRLFVSADVASTATQNATLRLALPAAPDPGVGMSSGNTGPLDVAVANPGLLTVSDVDRVTLAALTLAGGTAEPGTHQLPLMSLAVTSTYSVSRTLTALVVGNATTGPGTQAERDGEARLVTLRADGNGNGALDGTDADPVLATGSFQSGQATFAGLNVVVPPGTSRVLFVTVDLSTTGARDGDVVGATVANANSVNFAEPTSVTGQWPLDSGARWTLDGFTAAQVTNVGAAGATVSPGDGPILALDVVLPRNGYAADLLRGVRLTNLGTAHPADLSQVQLWRDGGDGVFTGGGDDVLLGPLTPSGADWTSPLLSTPVTGPGLRVFVSVNIAAAAAETTTVRFQIPVGGVEYESTNDGPLDSGVANPEAILISSAPLLATIGVPRASTVGQTVAVAMIVRNTGSETVRNVTAPTPELSGTATLAYASGPMPAAFDLAPAASDTLIWQYTATGVGDARFAATAGGTGDPSGLPRNAPRATSNAHRVYLAAQHLDLTPVQTMPIRVNRGQKNVVPFSLTLAHPGGADASDVSVERLKVRLEEQSAAPIVPSALLDRVEVSEGTNVYLVKSALETSGSEIDLPLATPVIVTGTQPATVSLSLDVDSLTTVGTFRVVIDDSTRISAQDATSGAPVTVRLSGSSYPLRSEVASIVAEATELDVATLAPDTVRTSRGLTGATLARFRMTSPGVSGISSNVRVSSLAVALSDSLGADLPTPGGTVSALRLEAGAQVVAQRGVAVTDGDTIVMTITPPIELAANVPIDLRLVGDISATAPFGRFGARLRDSAWVDARDANTRTPVPVHYAPAVIAGGPVTIEAPADTLSAAGVSSLPATVVIGQTDLLALAARLRHPGAPGTARLSVDSVSVEFVDDLRRPVVPRGRVSRVVVRWNGVDAVDLTDLPNADNRVSLPLGGRQLEPGDTARVELRIDVDAAAPAGFLELIVPPGGLWVRDANTLVPATLAPEPGAQLPLHSGLGRLTSPARDLAVGLVSLMPAALAGDDRPVAVGRLTLRNADAQGAGSIEVDHLVVRCSDRAYASQPLGTVATRVEAWLDGALWAQSAALTPDSVTATLPAPQRLGIASATMASLELRCVTRIAALAAGVRLGLDRADIGVVQPASAVLAINVAPEPGLAFPLWTESGVLGQATLEASYVNFPNPFAAGREATTVAYYMPEAGRVTLRVLTPRGEVVRTLLDGATRAAGQQQSDRWDGRNGRGDVVINGVYVAELEIRFDDGASKRLRRKLAVVR